MTVLKRRRRPFSSSMNYKKGYNYLLENSN